MNPSQIHSVYKEACRYISHNELLLAFERVKWLTIEAKAVGNESVALVEQYEDLRESYGFLLEYFVKGTEDSERKTMYKHFQQQLFVLASDLREALLGISTNYEYTEKRRLPHKNVKPAVEIFDLLTKIYQQIEIQQKVENPQIMIQNLRSKKELLDEQLFLTYWLKNNLTPQERQIFEKILNPEFPHLAEKALAVSALTLSLWRIFDEKNLELLFDCCQNADEKVCLRALTGLVFVLTKYNQFLPLFPFVHNRLTALCQDENSSKYLSNIILQIIGTNQTEGITRRMQEDIIPQMTQIVPQINALSEQANLAMNSEFDEENPEWQRIIEDSGLSDKFSEIAELQLEGADVYMSTFAALKHYAFFTRIFNWFLPFDFEQTDIERAIALEKLDEKPMLLTMMRSSMLCDSDKYSFFLSLQQMPENQRTSLFKMFNMEAAQFEEIQHEEQLFKPEKRTANLSKQYIQDLYRFFKLFPQRAEFADMFSTSLFVHKTLLFAILRENNPDNQLNTANFYFSKNLFAQAIEMFEQLAGDKSTDVAVFQKLGFACQKTGNIPQALNYYLKADLISPDSNWTLKKIALCYRLLGNFEKSLETYRHIDFLNPSVKTQMNIARCHVEMEQYQPARKIYAELEKTDDNQPLWQAIVWCAIAAGNLSEAEYYSGHCLDAKPESLDLFYAGHIALCRRKFVDALDFYLQSIDYQTENFKKENIATLLNGIVAHQKFLVASGVSSDELTFFRDAIWEKAEG